MEAVNDPVKPLYMDETHIEGFGHDAGIRNPAFCLGTLIGVSNIIGLDGPRTRTLIPRFLIEQWAVSDLENFPLEPYWDEEPQPPNVLKLSDLLDKPETKSLPTWRTALVNLLVSGKWEGLFETYYCPLTKRHELPAVGIENQLDASENIKWKKEFAILKSNQETLRAFLESPASDHLPTAVRKAIDEMANDNKIIIRDPDEFNRQRMYLLTQVLMSSIQSVDMIKNKNEADAIPPRYVTNHAKKFGLPSDGSLTYAERKEKAIEITRELLQRQRDSPDVTERERANGRRWLKFLDETEESGQKLDDLCDAFLDMIDLLLQIFQDFFREAKKGDNPPPMPRCLSPVTNKEIEEQGGVVPKRAAPQKPKEGEVKKKPAKPRKKPAVKVPARAAIASISKVDEKDEESTIDLMVVTVPKKRKREDEPAEKPKKEKKKEKKEKPPKKRARKE